MLTGKVVQFDDVRGYGFIAPDKGGEDVFVHVNVLGEDKYVFGPGLPVEFESTDSDRGPKAISVRIIDKRADLSGPSPWAVSPVTARLATVPRPALPADAPAPRPAVSQKEATDTEDDLCDVLTASAFSHDLTEQLLDSMPALTAGQITKLRETFLAFAKKHNWVEN